MSFLSRLLGKGCAHYFSWPRTDSDGHYYQICSRCGVAYEYDWDTMRLTNKRMAAEIAGGPASAAIATTRPTVRLPILR